MPADEAPTYAPSEQPPADRRMASQVLSGLARQYRENSERWFPKWHGPDLGMPLTVAYALGLAGEVGEVANVVKKMQRDGESAELAEGLGAELADCFIYLLLLADEAGVDLHAECEAKVLVNEVQRGDAATSLWTWETVPIGWFVPGSGIVVEKSPHVPAKGQHVTFHRLTPFVERWSAFRSNTDAVPIALTNVGLLHRPCKPGKGVRIVEVGRMMEVPR